MSSPITLTDEEVNEYERKLSKRAESQLGLSPTISTGWLVQHITDDFFAMYPDGYTYGITMNVEAEGRRNYAIVWAEDGQEVGPDLYFDTFKAALDKLRDMES